MSDMLDNLADKNKRKKRAHSDANEWEEYSRTEGEDAAMAGKDLGYIEAMLAARIRDLLIPILQDTAQIIADNQEMNCPVCHAKLLIKGRNRERKVNTAYGEISVKRTHGYCKECCKFYYPADKALGIDEHSPASPRVQELSALAVLGAPAGKAEERIRKTTGLNIGQSTLHNEARRQGKRALKVRDDDVELSKTPKGIMELETRYPASKGPFTLVIQIDAWNIRERDNWGKTADMDSRGENTKRWHWVYTGTVFRLDQRGKSNKGRNYISNRGYVATRQGLSAFEEQLYTEAILRGYNQAETVLIIADGAVWIWNIAERRFSGATQRVDLWHVSEHLWSVANDLYGKGSNEAKEWAERHTKWLKNRKTGVLDVINSLSDILENSDKLTEQQSKTVQRESAYMTNHQNRMAYKEGKKLNQPIGSGAMESTCAQYQCRFKRTGQFWSLEGDEQLLALQTLEWNERWGLLYPHDNANFE